MGICSLGFRCPLNSSFVDKAVRSTYKVDRINIVDSRFRGGHFKQKKLFCLENEMFVSSELDGCWFLEEVLI
jgi:hypothetical protein